MKVYQRYLAKEIYSAVTLVLVAFLMLFAFFDFINELQSLWESEEGRKASLGHPSIVVITPRLVGSAWIALTVRPTSTELSSSRRVA